MPVLNPLPAGNNKCIGSYAFEPTGKLYCFIYNSNGDHTITEYDNTLNTISIVLQGDYLNFQEYDYINGCGIAGENLLYWTDGVNPPRSIDIARAKSAEYYTDSSSISLIKTPPQELITAQYADDPLSTTASNRLKNQLFQFRYLYVYEDGSRSAWSSCSKVPLPQFEVNPATDTRAYKNNNIRIAFNAGTKFVKSIELAALVKGVSTTTTTQDWFSILTVNRANVIATIDNQFSYNPDDNTAIFTFYNDGLYQSIDVLETDLPYDYVPLTAKTLEIVNGNVLVLGNNKEGYDNITLDTSLFVTYAAPVTNELQEIGYSTYGYPEFIGIPTQGDTIYYQWDTVNNNSYTVTYEASGSLYNTLVALGNKIQTDSGIEFRGIVAGNTPGSLKLDLYYPPVLSAISVSHPADVSNSVASYKTNSRYQLGLVYYDDKNRSSYVQTNDNFIVSTDSWGETQGKAPTINWVIRHNAPSWATKYQWVRTEQLTHKSFLFWTATTATANAEDTIYSLDISSLITYNNNNPNSILAYDFSVGDRCTIHKQDATWVTGYDVSVVDYTQTTTTATLQIQKKSGTLTPGAMGILLEVYTPKTRANTTTEQFFYEFGEQYSCAAGVHSVTSGSFVDGDVYDRDRAIPTTGEIGIEDPNFSDFYISNYSSNGRANIFAPQAKQLTLPTDIRFSDVYVPNTNINGLSRFYGDAFETYDRVNGSIQKLAVRDNYLMTFQELKTGYIPILQSIIEDQGAGNAANVAISNKLLNKIRYFPGDYGIGLNPESFARYAGTMYFIDPNRGFVLKLVQGLQPISIIGMDSYFTSKLASVRTITNMKLIGSYDPRNDEYITIFKYPTGGGTSETVAFNEIINRWTSFYSFTPEHADYIFNKYMGFNNGVMWEHNSSNSYNSFYGTSYDSIVQLTFNGTPSLVKSFVGLMEQSNTVWYAKSNIVSSVETAIKTNLNQTSNLLASDFSKKEGVWFASILRDSSSPGGIINGDDLKGNLIKFRLVNEPTERASLLSAELRYIPSYQGIK